jgi:CheY-like chemotaxis protein
MKRVLIIEDNAAIREGIAEVLELEGYAVAEAGDGREGLEKAHETAPNLIILDLMMPCMNGWEFRAAQKQSPQLAGIPVVVLSAVATEPWSDMDDVSARFPKPFDVAALVSAVGQFST